MSNAPMLSIIVPMFNEADVLTAFFERLQASLRAVTPNYEVICLNDGSTDTTLSQLRAFAQQDERIKIINLSRNFGKEIALSAGFDFSSGNAVIPIDADLQDPPEYIPKMVQKWQAGAKVVLARRRDRSSDTWLKRMTARYAYWVFSKLTKPAIPSNVGDFRLLDRVVVEALKQLPERNRFMKGLFSWVGFEAVTIEYDRESRNAGTTSWNYWKLWNFTLDGITSFSSLPLRIWTYLGLSMSMLAFGYFCLILIKTAFYGVDVPGYASLISVMLFFHGILLIGLGVIGEYIGRIFMEVKNRPLYLVAEQIGFESNSERHDPADIESLGADDNAAKTASGLPPQRSVSSL